MTARVTTITGPAGSGKTERLLARYRDALVGGVPRSALWLAPTWRAAAAIRDRLIGGQFRGCFSPGVTTFERFADEVLRASPVPVRPLGRQMKRQLIRLLIDQHVEAGRIRHFLPIARTGGLVDQVGEFISELKRLDIWPEQLRRACQARGMREKDAEFLAVYETYQAILNDHHLYDAEGRFWSARRLLREGRRRPFERLRLVVVDGFTDFTPPQHEILQILGGWVEELLITLPLEAEPGRADLFSKPAGTLAELRRRHPDLLEQAVGRPAKPAWPAMGHLEANMFANPRQLRPAADTAGIEILAAPRQLGEIELIGLQIKRLLTEGPGGPGGRPVRPGEIAVVFRSLGEVDELVRDVFSKLGIPYAIESGQTLVRSAAMAALVGLIRLDVDDWTFRDLLGVLANNYFQPDWPEWEDGLAGVAAERAVRSLQIPRGRKRLIEQLHREVERSAPAGSGVGDESGPPSQTERALRLLLRLERAFDALPERASAGQWAAAWQGMAEDTGLVRAMEPDQASENAGQAVRRACAQNTVRDQDAWSALNKVLVESDRLCRLLGRDPAAWDHREALAFLLDTLGSVRVLEKADESGRVRVLSAASARALRIPYLFFAGLAERAFPPPDRQDRLYREAESRRLIDEGLPLVARTQRNRDEMLLFYEAMTRASRRLYFSYPALDETAQPLSPSPYLLEAEQACGEGRIRRTEVPDLSPIPAHDEPLSAAEFRVKAVSRALEGNVSLLAGLVGGGPELGPADGVGAGLRMVDARRDRKRFGASEGILCGAAARRSVAAWYGPARTFSATELELYASCPYRFFVERVLGIEPVEELDLAVDYRARGRLVHGALADLHQRINDSFEGPTSPADLDEEAYDRFLAETLQRVSGRSASSPLDAALHEVDRRLWTRWAGDYRRQHRSYDELWRDFSTALRPTWFEVSFGHARGSNSPLSTSQALELACGDELIRISGRIDRIDAGVIAGRPVFNVLDYKTGTSTRFSREAAVRGTAVQLPLYVIATEQLLLADRQAVPWRAGFWYVQDKGFKPRQALKMSRRRGGALRPESAWEELRNTIVVTVQGLLRGIRDAEFPVYSADEQCTRFCPFRTICRISQIRSLEKRWEPSADEA